MATKQLRQLLGPRVAPAGTGHARIVPGAFGEQKVAPVPVTRAR